MDHKSNLDTTISKKQEDQETVQFLLTEFAEVSNHWRHADDKIEKGIEYYVAFVAVALPSIILIYENVKDFKLFVLACLPIAGAIVMLSRLLIGRMIGTSIIKSEYIVCRGLIRRYFVDRNPDISPYLYFSSRQPGTDHLSKKQQMIPLFRSSLTLIILLLEASMIGAIVLGVVWYMTEPLLNLLAIVTIGVSSAGIAMYLLAYRYWLRIKEYKNTD